jgi:hypothetical protein
VAALVELGGGLLDLSAAYIALLLALVVSTVFFKPMASLADSYIPLVGGSVAHWIRAADNAVVGACERWAAWSLRLVVNLLIGLGEVFAVLIGVPLALGLGVYAALKALRHAVIPKLIAASVAPVRGIAHEAHALAVEANKLTRREIARVDAAARAYVTRLEHEAIAPLNAFLKIQWPAAKAELDATAHTVEVVLPKELAAVKAQAAAATAATGAIASNVNQAVSQAVGAIPSELTAAEGAAIAELPSLPGLSVDDLLGRLSGQDLATLGGLLAAVPLLRALSTVVTSEAGLDKAECRGKLKGVCSTDPTAWANLLEGLVALGVGLTLADLLRYCEDAVKLAEPVVHDLAA